MKEINFSLRRNPFELEQYFWVNQQVVAGVDEAGRGALAGPVVAAAVVFSAKALGLKDRIRDSKKLSSVQREKMYSEIMDLAEGVGVGIVHANRIDEINILQASLEAMKIAVEQISCKVDCCLVDGNQKFPMQIKQQTIIQGDDKVVSIGGASIIAKVTRDRMMVEYENEFKGYGFKKHKGYGTKEHRQAIFVQGKCRIHRKTFSVSKPV